MKVSSFAWELSHQKILTVGKLSLKNDGCILMGNFGGYKVAEKAPTNIIIWNTFFYGYKLQLSIDCTGLFACNTISITLKNAIVSVQFMELL